MDIQVAKMKYHISFRIIIRTHHGQCHAVYFVFVLSFMLSEWTVPLQKFVQHTTEGKPVCAGVVCSALREYLWRHISVRAAVTK